MQVYKLAGHCWVCRHSALKSYVCDFSSTVLAGLLTPQRGYWINCNTTQLRNDNGTMGGFCRLGLRLRGSPRQPHPVYRLSLPVQGWHRQGAVRPR